jgi:hypothetical protein
MKTLVFFAFAAIAAAQQNPQPCAGLPPGKHALLERLTAQLGLTCDQQLKVEPILHDEESVSKPLLKFSSFSPEDGQAAMTTIKLAARRQVRTVLTADQQKGMDDEVDSVGKSSGKKGGGRKGAKTSEPSVGLDDEETLSKAILKYSALTPQEKNQMLLKVKLAARSDSSLNLSPEQQRRLDAEISDLRK